jgi:uncharacterized OsmC-like protein
MTDTDKAEIDKARIDLAAAAALATAGCTAIQLVLPTAAKRLTINGTTGNIEVLDEDGSVLQGATPRRIAEELKAEYPKCFQ